MDLDDVALPESGDGVDHIVKSTSFDRKQAEAIVRFARVDEDDRDPSQIRNYVSDGTPADAPNYTEDGLTPDDCADIRRAMDRVDRPTTVIDRYKDKHPSVIFRHATGKCGHEPGVDPTTSPRIKGDECREMRVDLQTGDTVEDVRANYNRSANAVVRHVFGRCDHEFEHDRNGKELSKPLCDRMRRAYRENRSASIADIGRAFIVGASTAHRHLTGKCGHEHDVERPVASNGSCPIDKGECDRMRVGYGNGVDADTIADDFDRDATAVRKHVFGRCRHGQSPYSPERDAVGPKLCMAIRHKYRTRGVESVASVIDRLNTTRGTFYFHLKGKCSHEHDVPPVDPNE